MPDPWNPDADPTPPPQVVEWLRAKLRREFPHHAEPVIATAIFNAAALVHPRTRRGVILAAARISLPEPPPSPRAIPATPAPADCHPWLPEGMPPEAS